MQILFAEIILSISSLIVLGAFLLAQRRRRSGILLFCIRALLPAMIAATLAGVALVGIQETDSSPLDKKQYDHGIIAFLLAGACLALSIPFMAVACGLFHRTVVLQDIELQRRRGSIFRFAHLSDLHLTADRTLEHGLTADDVRMRCHEALRWALQSSDMVFITGDVTDSGSPEEWEVYQQMLHDLGEAGQNRIFVIPGNHDLCVPPFAPTTLHSIDGVVLKGRSWEEARCRDYVSSVFAGCPDTWKLSGDHAGIGIREIMSTARPYIKAYSENPPYFERVIGPKGRSITRLIVPDTLRQALEQLPRNALWPSKDRLLYRDLLDMAFPIVMLETKNITVIGLNSCTDQSQDVLGNALGLLGKEQLRRLADKISALPNDHTIILLLHHHIGFPSRAMKEFKQSVGARLKLTSCAH